MLMPFYANIGGTMNDNNAILESLKVEVSGDLTEEERQSFIECLLAEIRYETEKI